MTVWRKGELLFNDGRLCYQGWYSCASCHQEDGTMDALNWDLPNDGMGNPKNAKSLHDVRDSPPAMWAGVRSGHGRGGAGAGSGSSGHSRRNNHRALMEFIGNPRRAPNPYRGRDPEALERGRDIFVRARCEVCHPPPRLHRPDRSTTRRWPASTDLRSRFDTPTAARVLPHRPLPARRARGDAAGDLHRAQSATTCHGRTRASRTMSWMTCIEFLRSL